MTVTAALVRSPLHLAFLSANEPGIDHVLYRDAHMAQPIASAFPGRGVALGRERRLSRHPLAALRGIAANRRYYREVRLRLAPLAIDRLILFLEGEPLERMLADRFRGEIELWGRGPVALRRSDRPSVVRRARPGADPVGLLPARGDCAPGGPRPLPRPRPFRAVQPEPADAPADAANPGGAGHRIPAGGGPHRLTRAREGRSRAACRRLPAAAALPPASARGPHRNGRDADPAFPGSSSPRNRTASRTMSKFMGMRRSSRPPRPPCSTSASSRAASTCRACSGSRGCTTCSRGGRPIQCASRPTRPRSLPS